MEIQGIKIMQPTAIIGVSSMLIQENAFTKQDINGQGSKKVQILIMPIKYYGVDFMNTTYKQKYNKKYGYSKNKSHSISDISKKTGYSESGLKTIYKKGQGAFFSNPSSVRPGVKSSQQWGMARVYAAINPKSKAYKVDKIHLKKKTKRGNKNGKKRSYKKYR